MRNILLYKKTSAILISLIILGSAVLAGEFEVPQGRWKEKKGTAELVIAQNNILFRKSAGEDQIMYSFELSGRVRNEYWLDFTGNKPLPEFQRALLVFKKYTLEVMFFDENQGVQKYIFEK